MQDFVSRWCGLNNANRSDYSSLPLSRQGQVVRDCEMSAQGKEGRGGARQETDPARCRQAVSVDGRSGDG